MYNRKRIESLSDGNAEAHTLILKMMAELAHQPMVVQSLLAFVERSKIRGQAIVDLYKVADGDVNTFIDKVTETLTTS